MTNGNCEWLILHAKNIFLKKKEGYATVNCWENNVHDKHGRMSVVCRNRWQHGKMFSARWPVCQQVWNRNRNQYFEVWKRASGSKVEDLNTKCG